MCPIVEIASAGTPGLNFREFRCSPALSLHSSINLAHDQTWRAILEHTPSQMPNRTSPVTDVVTTDSLLILVLSPMGCKNTQEAVESRSIAESGYQSMASGNAPANSLNNVGSTRSRPISGTSLFWYKNSPDPEQKKRYKSVQQVIEAALHVKAAEHGRNPSSNLAIQPMVIGETEHEAVLRFVVFCHPDLKEAFDDEFGTECMQNLLKLPRNTGRPRAENNPSREYTQCQLSNSKQLVSICFLVLMPITSWDHDNTRGES